MSDDETTRSDLYFQAIKANVDARYVIHNHIQLELILEIELAIKRIETTLLMLAGAPFVFDDDAQYAELVEESVAGLKKEIESFKRASENTRQLYLADKKDGKTND